MGLESINYKIIVDKESNDILSNYSNVESFNNKKYVLKENNKYWIDIEIDNKSLSIRIALCNPEEEILQALHKLFSYLFKISKTQLKDLHSKEIFKKYDENTKNKIEKSYKKKKESFKKIYGDYTAAISSEEFYKRIL